MEACPRGCSDTQGTRWQIEVSLSCVSLPWQTDEAGDVGTHCSRGEFKSNLLSRGEDRLGAGVLWLWPIRRPQASVYGSAVRALCLRLNASTVRPLQGPRCETVRVNTIERFAPRLEWFICRSHCFRFFLHQSNIYAWKLLQSHIIQCLLWSMIDYSNNSKCY